MQASVSEYGRMKIQCFVFRWQGDGNGVGGGANPASYGHSFKESSIVPFYMPVLRVDFLVPASNHPFIHSSMHIVFAECAPEQQLRC